MAKESRIWCEPVPSQAESTFKLQVERLLYSSGKPSRVYPLAYI